MSEPSARCRRGKWAIPVAVLLAIGGYFFANRASAPAIPDVDLSRADAEVAVAVTRALDAARRRPRDAAAHGELGMVLRANDFDLESVGAFAAAESLDPADWRWPYLRGLTLVHFEPDRGADCLKRAAERAPPDIAEPKLRYAEVLFERGELDTVERLAAGVRGPRAAILMARIAAGRDDWPAVLSLTEAVRDNEWSRKRAAMLRAEAHGRGNDAVRAGEEWRRIAKSPDDPAWPDRAVEEVLKRAAGRSNRLRAVGDLLAAGRAPDAVDALDRLIRDDPHGNGARLLLGQTLVRAGESPRAETVLRELVARDAESVEGHFQLGVSRFLNGNPKEALASFDRAILLKPDHLLAHFNRGHCLRKLGEPARAAAAFEAALRCKPDHQPSHDAIRAIRAEGK